MTHVVKTKKDSEKDQMLLDAAEKGDLEGVKAALAQGADINAKGVSDQTPFFKACLHGIQSKEENEIVRFLLEKGANVSDDILSTIQLKVNILAENAESGMVLQSGVDAWKSYLNYLIAARVKQDIPKTIKRFSEDDAKVKKELAHGLSRSALYGMDISLAVSGLEKALADGDKDVRFFASLALCLYYITKKDLKGADKLSKHLDISVRSGVAYALLESAKNEIDISFVKEVMRDLLMDKDEDVKNTAINAFEIAEQRKK